MEGDRRKQVSWKGQETGDAGAGGVEEVLEYQVEEGNSTRRKVEEIEMQKRRKKSKMEEERKRLQRLKEFHDQYDEHQAKLQEWSKTIPDNKPNVTDDKFRFEEPGVPSPNYFPLFLNKKREERIERAKEKGRHTIGSPHLLFIQSKGRFVSHFTMD